MKKNTLTRKILALVLCVLLALPSFGLFTFAEQTNGTVDYTADVDTTDSYRDLIALRDNSRRAGRVWADKSVFTDQIELDMESDGIDKNTYGKDPIIMNESDFLHVFSAIGSSQTVNSYQPLDVVFILDTSASMSSQGENKRFYSKPPEDNPTNNNPRLECAADALNDAFDLLMNADENNRVGLVTFSLGAQEILPLGRYDPTTVNRRSNQSNGYHNGEKRYFTIAQCSYTGSISSLEKTNYDNRFEQKIYNNQRFIDNQGLAADWKIMEINAVEKKSQSSKVIVTDDDTSAEVYGLYRSKTKGPDGLGIPYIHTSSGTDTAWGFIKGMQMLATQKDTKVKLYRDEQGNLSSKDNGTEAVYEVQRQPVVVMLTDGAPNPSSTGTKGYADNWWDGSGTTHGKESIARYDEANGLLVAATAAYQKQQVEKNYYGSIPKHPEIKDEYSTLVYNFGICMDDPDSDTELVSYDGQVSHAALEPSCLDDKNRRAKYPFLQTIYDWWQIYKGNGKPTITENWDKEKQKTKTENAKKDYYAYTMNHPRSDDIKSLDYPTNYENISDPLTLSRKLTEMLMEPYKDHIFDPVGGKNDIGVTDALSYMDPIGKYMEVKNVKKLLLFGQLYDIEKDGREEYFNSDGSTATKDNHIYSIQRYKVKNKGKDEIVNPCYGAESGMTFKLSKIEIYVKTTGNYTDEEVGDGGIKSDLGYDQALYINIPALALPMQVANVTMTSNDSIVSYETNIGTDEDKKADYDTYVKKRIQSSPLRVFYDVGIADAIKTSNGNIDLTKVSPDYRTENSNGDEDDTDGDVKKIYFYSNWFKRDKEPYGDYVSGSAQYTYGDPVLTFSPAVKNRYYVFQKKLPLYANPNGDTKGGIVRKNSAGNYTLNGTTLNTVQSVDHDSWYYILIEYFDPNENSLVRYALPRIGSEFGAGVGGFSGDSTENEYLCWYNPETEESQDYMSDGKVTPRPGDGFVVAADKGGLRVGDMSAGIGEKDAYNTRSRAVTDNNSTNTSSTYYLPTVSSTTTGENVIINLYLGNNGRLSVEDTQLLVTKTVDHIGADSKDLKKAVFNYDIHIDGYKGELNAIEATKESNGTWRALIDTIELVTSNQGLLLNKDGTLATDSSGKFYIYVGGDANDNYTYKLFDSSRGDSFHDKLGTSVDGKDVDLTVEAYLIPIPEGGLDSSWNFNNLTDEEKAKLTKDDKFKVGYVGFADGSQIGFAAKLDYQSDTAYKTKKLHFDDNGDSSFQLKDGEGLLFIGLISGRQYTVTEKLSAEQIDKGIILKNIRHKENDSNNNEKWTTYYPKDFDSDSYEYSVSGDTTAVLTEEVDFYNFIPKTEKTEIDHGNDGFAKIGDTLTYVIYWENYAMDEVNGDIKYVDNNVTVTDLLDDGVDFEWAGYAKKTVDAEGNEIFVEDSAPKGWKAPTYNASTRTVTWLGQPAVGGASGYVMLKVKVNEKAEEYWNKYEPEDNTPEKDYKVLNKAKVHVENYREIETEIVKTNLGEPHKTQTDVGDVRVSEKDGNLRVDETTGNLVGPRVKDKDEITYKVSYVNYKDTKATVTVIDKLDPGVTFVSASWKDVTLRANDRNVDINNRIKISYDKGEHSVKWEIKDVDALSDGYVILVVKLNNKAANDWHYIGDELESGEGEGKDYKIFNRASVQLKYEVGVDNDGDGEADEYEEKEDDPRITETVENPLGPPHKTQLAVGDTEVSEDEGNLKLDETSGNLVGPVVKNKDNVTYSISYVNYKESEATVIVKDKLDPGVTFVSASWFDSTNKEDITLNVRDEDVVQDESLNVEDLIKISYDKSEHSVKWEIKNVPALSSGNVTVVVKTNDTAEDNWHYGDGLEGEEGTGKDYKIFNRASVQLVTKVGKDNDGDGVIDEDEYEDEYDDEQFTETIENPMGTPHKTQLSVDETEVSEENGNLRLDETTGNLVGPKVRDGGVVTYSISFVNYKDTEATVIVTDKLDPGVTFVSASWKDITLNVQNENVVQDENLDIADIIKISYDKDTHTVKWEIKNVPALSKGDVKVVVKTNDKANDNWHYGDGLEGQTGEGEDYKIFNRASVQLVTKVGKDKNDDGIIDEDEYVDEYDDEQFTETVENPLGSIVNFPISGGMGTYLFYLLGGALLVLALAVAVIVYRKRRTSPQADA